MNINTEYLRAAKSEELRKLHKKIEKKKELAVEIYENAIILPVRKVEGDKFLFGRGGVLDQNDEYVDLSALKDRVEGKYEYLKVDYREEKVVYCGYFVKHWGHFLIESVARMWYFLKNDPTIEKYIFVVDYMGKVDVDGNYKEFFCRLGVWDKLEFLNCPVRFREVVVPELSYKRQCYFSDWYKMIYNRVIENTLLEMGVRDEGERAKEKDNKLFFSRSQLPKAHRYESGLELMDNFFEKNGYEILYPEKISLSEMIFALHGGGRRMRSYFGYVVP